MQYKDRDMYKNFTKYLITSILLASLFTSTVYAEGLTTDLRPSVTYSEQLEYFNKFKQSPSTPSGGNAVSSNTPSSDSVDNSNKPDVNTVSNEVPNTASGLDAPSVETVVSYATDATSASTSTKSISGYLPVAAETPPTYRNGLLRRDSALPASYKTANITTPRKQTGDGPCWAFSEAAAQEQSAIIHASAPTTIQIDEEYIHSSLITPPASQFNLTQGDTATRTSTDPGGNQIFTVWELASNCIPTLKGSTTPAYTPIECKFINISETTDIKRAIMANGSVEIGVIFDSSNTTDYKYKSTGSLNHSILLLGWDDSIPASSFTAGSGETPTINGAWYFKDSGGFTDSGFGWLSYDDAAFHDTTYNRAFTTRLSTYPKTDNLYQYDGTFSYKTLAAKKFTNIFRMQSGSDTETIKAVGLGSATTGTFKLAVDVYDNASGTGTPLNSTSQDVTFTNWGYRIVDLSTPIDAPKGTYVFVSVYHEGGSEIYMCVDEPMQFGSSTEYIQFSPTAADGQFLIDGKSYSTVGNKTPRIKLFTQNKVDTRTDISTAKVTVDTTSFAFTGSAHEPTPTVKLGETVIPSSDYSVSYTNNVNAGTANVIITAKPSSATYKGRTTGTFNIASANMSDVVQNSTVTALVGTTFENVGKKADLTLGSYTLKYGTDFVATKPSLVVTVDTTEVEVQGLTNFTGTRIIRVNGSSTTIDISTATIATIPDQTYTGSPITLSDSVLVVTCDGSTLKKDTDYTVAYSNNTNVGTATFTLTGKGLYTGTKQGSFKIINGSPTPTPTPSSTHPPLSSSEAQLAKGKSTTVKVPNAKYSIVWSMSNPEVAKVNTKGQITAIAPGTCYIYAYTNNTLYAPCKVIVTD